MSYDPREDELGFMDEELGAVKGKLRKKIKKGLKKAVKVAAVAGTGGAYLLADKKARKGLVKGVKQGAPVLKKIGKVGLKLAPMVAAPFTGGASLAASPALMQLGKAPLKKLTNKLKRSPAPPKSMTQVSQIPVDDTQAAERMISTYAARRGMSPSEALEQVEEAFQARGNAPGEATMTLSLMTRSGQMDDELGIMPPKKKVVKKSAPAKKPAPAKKQAPAKKPVPVKKPAAAKKPAPNKKPAPTKKPVPTRKPVPTKSPVKKTALAKKPTPAKKPHITKLPTTHIVGNPDDAVKSAVSIVPPKVRDDVLQAVKAQSAGDTRAMDRLSQTLTPTEQAKVNTMLTILQDGPRKESLKEAVAAIDPETQQELMDTLKSGDVDKLDQMTSDDPAVADVVDKLQVQQAGMLPAGMDKYIPYAVGGAILLSIVYSMKSGNNRR